MSLIRPFAGLRPAAGRAADVAAPPYDVLSSEEARQRAEGKPWSFLHVSKPEIDLTPGTDPYSPAVYAKAAENLGDMIAQGVLVRDDQPCLYVYRLATGDVVQTGLVAAGSLAEYDSNRIRKHELTRPEKEDDRVRQIEALNAQTGPVLLAYPDAAQVDAMLASAAAGDPDSDVVADDGVRHSIWVIRDPGTIERLVTLFEAMPALYIADGHHRSAAASRVAAARRSANPASTGDEDYNYFLVVAFPESEMRILPYNRAVRDLNDMTGEEFRAHIVERFEIQPSSTPVSPETPRTFGLYLQGAWYRLAIRPKYIREQDPIARLDVSLLADNLLAPILDISDPRRDERIEFIGGIRGLSELERRVDSGEMACAFSVHATSMRDLMVVADANEVMPPKSTWFEPKLADGLVSLQLD
ncbi:MAG: DUF1015 domain-containing protein [Betaproteobacteria bacterium]|nr:MAG: DUF1015 domain-containing protein [Betaproteobacteria bacterium]